MSCQVPLNAFSVAHLCYWNISPLPAGTMLSFIHTRLWRYPGVGRILPWFSGRWLSLPPSYAHLPAFQPWWEDSCLPCLPVRTREGFSAHSAPPTGLGSLAARGGVPSKLVCTHACSVMSDSLNPMDCSPPGSSVHGIFQARILEWVAIPFSRGSSQPKDWTWVSHIVGRFFAIWATREASLGWQFHIISFCPTAMNQFWSGAIPWNSLPPPLSFRHTFSNEVWTSNGKEGLSKFVPFLSSFPQPSKSL